MKSNPALLCLVAACTFALIPPAFSMATGCSDGEHCSELKWGYSPHTFDQYEANADQVTPEGTHFDPSGQNISGELIDRLTGEVEACLTKSGKLDHPIDRGAFVVKVASDWQLNCDKTQQLLPVLAGSAGCVAKGLTPTEQCPCRWRAGIRCPNVLVVTPNFYLYKDVLIRFTLGVQNPWTPDLATCASPSTTPLSDGSDPKNGL